MTKMGRPPKWHKKIKAPPEALEFYELISRLQNSAAFRECHIFEGVNLHHIPYVSWEGKVTALPKVLTLFLGLPYRRKTCATHGCCNPLHFIDVVQGETLSGLSNPEERKTLPVSLDDYIETIDYYMEENAISGPPDFKVLRRIIPKEDIPDEILALSIEKMNNA